MPARPAKPGSTAAIDLTAHAAVPVLFFLLVWAFHPFHDVFQFDSDEGNNLIKALLMAKGHALYSEIWSDQPPLFTYMLRAWFVMTGWTVHQGRILVLICSSILLWALYQTVRLTWGHVAAVASTLLLVMTEDYIRLSVSVMIGLPALMFVMLSIYAIVKYRNSPYPGWMILSGVFLSLSLLTKLFTGLVVPFVVLAMLQVAWSRRSDPQGGRQWLRPVLFWSGGFVLAGLSVFLAAIPVGDLMQLIQPHLDAKKLMAHIDYGEDYSQMIKADYEFALLGIAGLLQILRRREWFSLLPVFWYLLALLMLLTHRPLWYHHYLLMSIPMCWTAGAAVGPFFSRDMWKSWMPWKGLASTFAAVTLVLTLGLGMVVIASIPEKFDRDYGGEFVAAAACDRHVVAMMKQFAGETHYVVSDKQVFPFSEGLIVPPELSVTSFKRTRSGHLTPEELVHILEKYQPEQIFLSSLRRIPWTQGLLTYLNRNYTSIFRAGDRLYLINELADNAMPALERAIEEVPDCWKGHYNMGFHLVKAGRPEEAHRAFRRSIDLLRQAVQVNSTDANAHHNLGIVLAGRGELEDAIQHFRLALELSPGGSGTHFNLANALARQGHLDEAIGHFRKALKIKPDYVEAYDQLGSVLAAQGHLDRAIDQFRQALRIRPEFADAHESLGRALAEQGKRDEAVKHFEEALRIMKSHPEASAAR